LNPLAIDSSSPTDRSFPGGLRPERPASPLKEAVLPSSITQTVQLQFPELIDITTLAELLGVRERYVRRMIQERRVRS